MDNKLRLGMLFSGGGTTMCRIITECQPGGLLDNKVNPVIAVTNNPEAGGRSRAVEAGMHSDNIRVCKPPPRSDHEGRLQWGRDLAEIFVERKVDWIGQYGWLPLTPLTLLKAFPGRMTNQHPGNPNYFGGPGMYGRRVHCARLLYACFTGRDPFTEVISQLVAPRYDEGAILNLQTVPIHPGKDTVDDLQERALAVEHAVQVETLAGIADGQITSATKLECAKLVDSDGDQTLLDFCKRAAIHLYPKG